MSTAHSLDNPIQVLIADTKQLWTGLLVERLRQVPGIMAFPNTSPEQFLHEIALLLPDITLLGIEDASSAPAVFQMLQSARELRPSLHNVVLLNSMDSGIIRESFFAGANGVISPNEPFDVLLDCIRSVDAGRIWLRNDQFTCFQELLDSSPASQAIVDVCDSDVLTDRQLKLVQCVAKGMTNREIALQLDLSEHTVRNYLVRIFRKFGVSNRAELVSSALQHA